MFKRQGFKRCQKEALSQEGAVREEALPDEGNNDAVRGGLLLSEAP